MPKASWTWNSLNDALRDADEKVCQAFLKAELSRREPRPKYLLRMHSRLNKVRADRERAELVKRAS